MDELVEMVVKKTGLSEEQAISVVKVVIDFIKDKLPPAIAGQVDGLLEGKGLGGAADMLGGLFG